MRMAARLSTWLATTSSLISLTGFADNSMLNMTPGVTPISRDIYDLHMTIFIISMVIGILVFGVLIYALVNHRKSKGHNAVNFHGNTKVEVTLTIIPFLILVAMAIPATMVLKRMDDNAKSDVTIKITGYQWYWQYEYLDHGISYYSRLSTPQDQLEGKAKKGKWYLLEVDKPLVVPIHKKIRFLVTSKDVIHSWWVPDFGIKRDAIPGFVHEAWARIEKPGIYRGQCAELCGVNHGFMPIVVVAKTEKEYEKWVAKQTNKSSAPAAPAKDMSKTDLMTLGKTTYNQLCGVCHKPDGAGSPPTFPALKGSPIATDASKIKDHINIILHGKQGTAMQAFANQLDDKQIAAVVTYERNAWGNDSKQSAGSDIVQPKQVFALRHNTTVAAAEKAAAPAPAATETNATPATPTTPEASKPAEAAPTAAAPSSKADLMKQGEATYNQICAACHKPDGSGMPPTFPALKGSALTIDPSKVNDHIDIILNGKKGTAMQAFASQLNDEQIAAVVTYERNAWDNDKKQANGSDVVTTEQVAKRRQ